jgi:hypothetical protein
VLEVGFNSYEEQNEVLSKLVPVLTKADQIQIRPWTFAVRNLNQKRFPFSTKIREHPEGMFVPDEATTKVLEEKEQYFFKEFIAPIGDRITIKTFDDSKFSLPPRVVDERILVDEWHVRHRGVVDHERFEELASVYPSHKRIFDRLHEGSSVVACSSLFRFNLNRLMAVVLSRTATSAAGRIDGALSAQRWSMLRLSEARSLSNFRIFDISTRRFVFDLQKDVLN